MPKETEHAGSQEPAQPAAETKPAMPHSIRVMACVSLPDDPWAKCKRKVPITDRNGNDTGKTQEVDDYRRSGEYFDMPFAKDKGKEFKEAAERGYIGPPEDPPADALWYWKTLGFFKEPETEDGLGW